MFSSTATTHRIVVRVVSRFDPDRSNPPAGQWFFLYTVRLTNTGSDTVQLLSRHWVITDGDGEVEQVRGPGVVGEQPILAAGESFEYTSGCPLPTAVGVMQGSYQMVDSKGAGFDVEIVPFTLSEPYAVQ